ncbi:Smr/MutS family protein [Pseudooceanicola sp. CBS1P-1]|uniref:DNA mismatch repair protein MutS n=1 Tax=Pseudooceanicola albus TaxID=2692189 RepID=A0A6L7FXB0_9RHOB|nr:MULTISPECIES: Smr/MutS family protein [Pseudooceanicola]MBT9385720.1 Smr/MutS family protein [Pseudooceanicola endophyticus]MXN16754.1 DNA mismatch repair protein MutS [Pseudooceanicola albus]
MSRRRRLSAEEIELWQSVAGQAKRMHPEGKPPAPAPQPPKKTAPVPRPMPDPEPAIPAFRLGQNAGGRVPPHDVLDPLPDRLHRAPVRMDKKTHGKMKKGKMTPEARIDLHGMTVERAHRALTGFILRAMSQDMRLVLVITGKGRRNDDEGPIPVRHGILRHQLPHWLALPPLSQCVLQVSAAHLKHGGTGAYYIYLRRNR